MLIILLTFALIRVLRGVPLGSPSEPPDPFPALALRDTQSHFGQRTVNDIVISCLATIFACTWSAIHPNIPAVTDSKWTCFKRQMTITICALLAPELITYWAMKQRLSAKKIMDNYNEDINGLTLDSEPKTLLERLKGWFQAVFATISGVFQDSPLPVTLEDGKGPQWTLAHGFFLQMGGFMLSENGRPTQMLVDSINTSWLFSIADTQKLIWNIHAKVIEPPRITEEDIKDRSKGDAISKIFIILQTTWFIVQCIARWSQHLPVTELEVTTLGFAMLNGITYVLWWDKPQNVGRPVFLESKKPNPLLQQAEPGKESWLRRKLRQEMEEHAHSPNLLWRLPSRIFHALARPLLKMFGGNTVTKMRVGMFYTAWNSGANAVYAGAAIGALFGSVHLIPSWFLRFSSRQEMWLWHGSAIIITAAPVLTGAPILFVEVFNQNFLLITFSIFMRVGFILYPIARIILLTLSLTTLRSLPPGALQTIEWTTFIPHL